VPEQRGNRRWTTEMELLAQVIEEVSVLAADHRRKEPRLVPRPGHVQRGGGTHADPYKRGVAMLAATTRQVRRAG
jgi:hypothetical protein